MFRKRKLTLAVPETVALNRLETQLRVIPLRGWIKSGKFRIYKTMVPKYLQSNIYPIRGDYTKTEDGICFCYTIRPNIPALIISFILVATFFHSGYTFIVHGGTWFFPALLLLWNVLFHAFIIWEEWMCIRSFEDHMQMDITENS